MPRDLSRFEAVDFGAAKGEDAGFLTRQPRAGMTKSRVFSWFVILVGVAAAREESRPLSRAYKIDSLNITWRQDFRIGFKSGSPCGQRFRHIIAINLRPRLLY